MLSFLRPGIALAVVLGLAGEAGAQRRAPSALVDAVIACEPVGDAGERVACYDRAVRALKEARQESRESFSDRAIRRPKPEFQEVKTTIRSVTVQDGGFMLLVMDDGSVWRSVEGSRLFPRKGDAVTISKGAFGSFLGDLGELRGVRVRPLG